MVVIDLNFNNPKLRKTIKSLAEFLDEVHESLERAIEGIKIQELNWRSSPNSNSIGNLLKHILGAEAFWIHHIIGGRETRRVRASEFETQEFQFNQLLEEFFQVKEQTKLVLAEVRDEQLIELRTYWSQLSNQTKETTVFWCLMHIIEHSALHIGQILFIRKMYGDSQKVMA
ncbi:MAG: DinB family protein [Candidatus Hermodarchaeota archaeon]